MRNLGAQEKSLRLYSLLPVSTQEEVSVVPQYAPKPDATDVEDTKGLALWQHQIAPKGEWSASLGYDITYPKGKHLIGL